MTIWENVSTIIIKKLIVNFNTKESFQYFYRTVILFDSVYRKHRNYYLKEFQKKFIHSLFWRSIIFSFSGFGVFMLVGRKFHFPKYNNLVKSGLFLFFDPRKLLPKTQDVFQGLPLLKYKKFMFPKYKKSFLLRKNFLGGFLFPET